MKYLVKTPAWLKWMYPKRVWHVPTKDKVLYLTFDDGPHADVTLFVLEQLQRFNAKGTFFCIGKNVLQHPSVFSRITLEGHRVGNHTQHHLNGWNTDTATYLHDVREASRQIPGNLFRPPYGRMRSIQAREVPNAMQQESAKIIMWDVLSGDFDESIDGHRCSVNVLQNARPGSIVVFHDSEKAYPRLNVALPATLEYFSKRGFRFEALPFN